MHIVHAKLNDEDEALNNDDFAVLGTFFSISNNANDVDQEADEALKTLTQHFHKIQFKGKNETSKFFNVNLNNSFFINESWQEIKAIFILYH